MIICFKLHIPQKHSAAQWTSLTLSQGRAVERQMVSSSWSSLSRAVEVKNRNGASFHHGIGAQDREHHSGSALPHAQVARSELNVRVTRGKITSVMCSSVQFAIDDAF